MTRRRTAASCTAAVVAFAGLTATTALPAAADDVTVPQRLALTGMAADASRGVYWTITSPTSNVLTAINADGSVAGTLTLQTRVTNLQALASRGGVLYVGDIGDPKKTRATITVYRIGEPTLGGTVEPRTWTFSYPDGPHDAAALMISPRGLLHVVTRGDRPGIYRATGQPTAGGTNTLRRMADAPVGVADGTFMPTVARFALWADSGLWIYDGYDYSVDAVGPVRRTGEAVSASLDDSQTLVLGTGGAQPRLVSAALPTGKQSLPVTPTPSVKASTKPAAAASPSAKAAAAPSKKRNDRSGTFWAIGLATLLALAAGGVTFWRPAALDDLAERPRR